MKTFFLALLLFPGTNLIAQSKFFTRNGTIQFFSKAPLENIESTNKSVTCVLDASSGALQFAVLIKGFVFQKALMQQHFNENYMESDKYPRSEFRGTIENNGAVNYTTNGSYPVKVKGNLTIHGVTKEVSSDGIIKVDGDKLTTSASFNLEVADFNIRIPSIVKDKIAKTVNVKVDADLVPLKQ